MRFDFNREGRPMLPRRLLLVMTASALLLGLGASDVLGQYAPFYRPGPQRGPQPPVSPYLNLLRGRNTAVNYYLGVQPEFERRQFQQQILLGEERRQLPPEEPATELFPKLAGTGHPAVFMNYGGYYNAGGVSGLQQPFPTYPTKK